MFFSINIRPQEPITLIKMVLSLATEAPSKYYNKKVNYLVSSCPNDFWMIPYPHGLKMQKQGTRQCALIA